MNDGCGLSGRVQEQPKTCSKYGGEDFSQAVAKVAVAQVCESQGFQTFHQSALEALSDVALRYICNIGKIAHFNANFSGRTESNAFDIIHALEDLGSIQGFPGASDVDHCLASSGTIKEIARYVHEAEQIPFAYSVPPFPVVKDRKLAPSFLQIGEEPPSEDIPAWLPAFPNPLTYIHSPSWDERVTEHYKVKMEQEKQQRKTERSLLCFHQRLSNGLEGSTMVDNVDAAKAKQARESNPFLAPPLRLGEKEVSLATPPAKLANNTIVKNPAVEDCIMDTSSPAIESMKCKVGDREEESPINKRPIVRFKIGSGKNPLSTVMELKTVNNGSEKSSCWFASENEKDDKKRRTEKILKDSMENSQELAQL